MGAIIENYDYAKAVDMALKAGNDLLLLCHQFDKLELAANIAHQQPKAENEASLQRIAKALDRVCSFKTTNFSNVLRINRDERFNKRQSFSNIHSTSISTNTQRVKLFLNNEENLTIHLFKNR